MFGFNPLEDLRQAMETFVTSLMTIFSVMLGQPVSPANNNVYDDLMVAFITLALYLSIPVSSIVILIELDDLTELGDRVDLREEALKYVGCSRARVLLYVIAPPFLASSFGAV